MTKKDIVRTISEEVGLTQQQTKEIVQKTFDAIIDTLLRDGRIELRNFGVFEVKTRAARRARNPRTGEEVTVPKKHVVTFKPGKYMESIVQNLDLETFDSIDSKPSKPSGTNNPDSSAPPNHSGRWDTD
ncbi:HU family DNA-binding protein [Stieleria varia]|uniref:DNA-binding protein HU n=1 Tax=Stieleria varia TaxID=2528005 RepID=A0A5C6ASV0_9BACT|nr:HU family DNA-binding protein [Stieleria varia]TWU02146.1 DNA-binding protein HU [Stieleria varia]